MAELIATLLLIAMTISAAVLLYAFVSGLFPSYTNGGPSTLVTATGQMTIPGSSGPLGVLTITVTNDGSAPISSITATCASPPFAIVNCIPGANFQYKGAQVSAANPLPVNYFASGTVQVSAAAASSFTAGTSYVVTTTVIFVGGSTQVLLVNVVATS
jgi:flagellin-like protein